MLRGVVFLEPTIEGRRSRPLGKPGIIDPSQHKPPFGKTSSWGKLLLGSMSLLKTIRQMLAHYAGLNRQCPRSQPGALQAPPQELTWHLFPQKKMTEVPGALPDYSASAWLASLILSPMSYITRNNAATLIFQMRRIYQVLELGYLSATGAYRRIDSREVHVNLVHCRAVTWRFSNGHDPSVCAFIHVNESLPHGDITATHRRNIGFEQILDHQSNNLSETWSVGPELVTWDFHDVATRLIFWQHLIVHGGVTASLERRVISAHSACKLIGDFRWYAWQVFVKNVCYRVCHVERREYVSS